MIEYETSGCPHKLHEVCRMRFCHGMDNKIQLTNKEKKCLIHTNIVDVNVEALIEIPFKIVEIVKIYINKNDETNYIQL